MKADPRPSKRVKNSDLMKRLHLELQGEPCEVCEKRPGTELHHVKFRSRGGDDSRENLLWICSFCAADHGALPSISRYDEGGSGGGAPFFRVAT